jgi:hypothetical protein
MKCRRALSRALPVVCLALLTVPVVDRAVALGDPVLVGAGDIANCNGGGDESTARLLDQIPGTVFTLGDNAYPGSALINMLNCFGPSWGRHKARTRPAIGNHDYLIPGGSGYYNYFGAAAGMRAKGYYSYNRGTWHVVVLNSNCWRVGGCGPGSPQEQWLRADLAANKAQCTVAYWHHGRFSSGAHGSDPDVQPLWKALYDFGADVVMSGHDHVYERFAPQTADGRADAAFGIRQFTVGTGGASLYRFRPQILPNSQARNATTFGVLKLTLHAGSYDWQFVPAGAGTFTDSGTASCHGTPPTPPTTRPTPPTTRPPTTRPTPTRGILFRAAASNESDRPRNSVTVDRPAGTRAGDVMVASVVLNDSDALTVPAGWREVREDMVSDLLRQSIYYRVATASDPSSFTWSIARDRRLAGGIASYAGVDTARPIDAHNAAVDTSGDATLTAPSITTTTSGGMLLALMAVNSDGVISPPSGLTERWERASEFPGTPRSVVAGWSDGPLGGAGPTGNRTATTNVAGPSIAALLALRPAAR